ncbi:MAG TPA: S9 family peptidase, partial [Lysobacter sp.]
MKQFLLAAALCGLCTPVMAAGVDVSAYVRRDQFTDLKISPTGQYLAATIPMEDRSILVVIERGTNKVAGSFK